MRNSANTSTDEHLDQPFRILSVDGGGICGAFVAGLMAGIEEQIKEPIGQYFDLIAGTSTGGIIAAALAFREPASKIERFYREYGPVIFRRPRIESSSRWQRALKRVFGPRIDGYLLGITGLDVDQVFRSKYSGDALREALTEVFGSKTLCESRTRLVIPSIDLTIGQTKVFKTAHMPKLHIDLHLPVVDIIMATTAAPTYFPHVVIQPGSVYVDGGLWANNPTVAAIAEAMAIRRECQRDEDPRFSLETMSVLSIGTGRLKQFMKPPAEGAGVAWWMAGGRLIRVTMLSQAQGALFQANYFLGRDRFHRIDFDLPDNTWNLDSICYLDEMIHNGRQKAADELASLRPRFFDRIAPGYTPFAPALAMVMQSGRT